MLRLFDGETHSSAAELGEDAVLRLPALLPRLVTGRPKRSLQAAYTLQDALSGFHHTGGQYLSLLRPLLDHSAEERQLLGSYQGRHSALGFAEAFMLKVGGVTLLEL